MSQTSNELQNRDVRIVLHLDLFLDLLLYDDPNKHEKLLQIEQLLTKLEKEAQQ